MSEVGRQEFVTRAREAKNSGEIVIAHSEFDHRIVIRARSMNEMKEKEGERVEQNEQIHVYQLQTNITIYNTYSTFKKSNKIMFMSWNFV